MRSRKRFVVCFSVLAALICFPVVVQAQGKDAVNPQKTADIKKLLDLMDTQTFTKMMVDQQTSALKMQYQGVTQDVWDEVLKGFDMSEVEKINIKYYDQYFSDDEIKQLIAFQESEVGKKIKTVFPEMMQKIMLDIQQWSTDMVDKAVETLKEKGFEPPQAGGMGQMGMPPSSMPAAK